MFAAIVKIRRMVSLKTFLVALASMTCAFLLGNYIAFQNVQAQGMPSTDADLIELLRAENGRLNQELLNNIAVIPMEYDDCVSALTSFYDTYPRYHYEDEENKVIIDFPILDHAEDAAQHCDYMLNVAFKDWATRVHNKGFTITRKATR